MKNKNDIFSFREFEFSPASKIECAVYGMIIDYNGVSILYSDTYSVKESSGVIILKERIENIVGILNENSDAIWLQQYCEEKEITFSILVTIYEEYLKKVTNNNI